MDNQTFGSGSAVYNEAKSPACVRDRLDSALSRVRSQVGRARMLADRINGAEPQEAAMPMPAMAPGSVQPIEGSLYDLEREFSLLDYQLERMDSRL